jgi:tetratricopeptide (TPR) repeat protein
MNRKNIYVAILLLPFVLGGCFGNFFNSQRVEREGMPDALKTKMEEQVAVGEKMLIEAKDDEAKKKALLEIAFSNEQLGKFDLAIPRYEEMLAVDPTNFQALNNLGVIYEELKDYEKSATYYGRLLNANPDNTEALGDTLRALILANHIDDAQSTLEAFAKANKDSTNEGMSKFISDEYQKIMDARASANTTSNEK